MRSFNKLKRLILLVLMADIIVVLIIFEGLSQVKELNVKGICAMCRRNKSMTVSDATIEAEGLKDFFKSVGRALVNFGKKVANNPVRALEIASKIVSAAAK